MKNIKAASERFFRLYYRHCVQPDLDTLFNLLNSIHSLNAKLNKSTKENFFDCNEFLALKVLRNLFHHQEELLNELRIIPVENLPPITTDLLFLCLVPKKLVQKSMENIPPKYREDQEAGMHQVLGWYGDVVNINPCIFNFAVIVYEKIKKIQMELSCDEYKEFETSYRFETQNGHSHFITGTISCHAGSVNDVLKIAFKKMA